MGEGGSWRMDLPHSSPGPLHAFIPLLQGPPYLTTQPHCLSLRTSVQVRKFQKLCHHFLFCIVGGPASQTVLFVKVLDFHHISIIKCLPARSKGQHIIIQHMGSQLGQSTWSSSWSSSCCHVSPHSTSD